VLFPTSSDSLTYSDEHRVLSAGYNSEITYQRDPGTHGINRITSPSRVQAFGYDGFERLASDSMSTLGLGAESFTYDAAGNRTGTPGTYSYATTNAARGRPAISGDATYAPGDSLVYDATGNPTWWKNKTTSAYDSLSWDAENRLTRFRRYSSGGSLQTDVQFAYDGFGRRVKKAVGSTVSLFVWSGWDLLAETNGTGGALRRYTMYPDAIDFSLAVREGSSSYWLHRDGQGNVYRVDNSSGVLRSSYRYRAWGDRSQVGTENYQSRLTYKGREEDRETGLVYMRHRYYSPRLERFVNQDPIGTSGGSNVYVFGGNSPCGGADPMGLWWDSEIPFSTFNYDDKDEQPCSEATGALGDPAIHRAADERMEASLESGNEEAALIFQDSDGSFRTENLQPGQINSQSSTNISYDIPPAGTPEFWGAMHTHSRDGPGGLRHDIQWIQQGHGGQSRYFPEIVVTPKYLYLINAYALDGAWQRCERD